MPRKEIKPNFSDSHESSPGVIVSFIPFTTPDTFYSLKSTSAHAQEALKTRHPIVVVNDVVSVNITHSKAQTVDTAEIQLLSGDVNYSAAIAPGDHAFVWLFNNQGDWKKTGDLVEKMGKSNGQDSGLKLIGKVNSVRQVLATQGNGIKTYRYVVTLSGFTELTTNIYFNELLGAGSKEFSADPSVQFFANVSKQFLDMYKSIKNNGRLNTIDVLSFFIDVFMGPGPEDAAKRDASGLVQSPNSAFLIPIQVAKYLGVAPTDKNSKAIGIQYTDVLQRIFGLQSYSGSMFPDALSKVRKNYYLSTPLKGGAVIPSGNFGNVTMWSLLHQHMNPTLNELYTTLKFIPDKGGIFPTVTCRQLPFSTEAVTKTKSTHKSDVTLFKDLPRWVISEKYPVFGYNIGTSDAERFNFFQTYTNSQSIQGEIALRYQDAQGNIATDLGDILRSGPRIHTTFSDTDALIGPNGQMQPSNINQWRDIIADIFANGHLKMNGSIQLAGIQDAIAIGDNLEFDNKVFHIEGIQHNYSVEPRSGIKSFYTTLMLSHGYYLRNDTLSYMVNENHKRSNISDLEAPGYSDEERHINDHVIISTETSTEDPTFKRPTQTFQTPLSAVQSLIQKYQNKK
jgi:hypothetical protein